MAAPPADRPRFGPFGTSFLALLVIGTLLFVGLLWTRSCGSDEAAISTPEQLEVEEMERGGAADLDGDADDAEQVDL